MNAPPNTTRRQKASSLCLPLTLLRCPTCPSTQGPVPRTSLLEHSHLNLRPARSGQDHVQQRHQAPGHTLTTASRVDARPASDRDTSQIAAGDGSDAASWTARHFPNPLEAPVTTMSVDMVSQLCATSCGQVGQAMHAKCQGWIGKSFTGNRQEISGCQNLAFQMRRFQRAELLRRLPRPRNYSRGLGRAC